MSGRGRERGREAVREVSRIRHHNRIFRRSPAWRSDRGYQSHLRSDRAYYPRGPEAFFERRIVSDRTGRLGNRQIELNRGNDFGLGGEEKTDRRREDSRNPALKKSFRDLFSDQDVDNGGKWVEVKRRRQRSRPRHRSPIIKDPCFRCGLGGHFRRNCPMRVNMRCFGCNSPFHLMRDCMVIQRPQAIKVELKNIFDINEKVESLSKFAIFRTKDLVNIHALRAAMIKEFWQISWQGKIFPIDKTSFLVGFVNELSRDQAVLAGRKLYDGFSGTFYAWDENRGATKVLRPVIVWLTLEGLPLHFWGKEEIKAIISPFGAIHKLGENFYQKKRADVVKVMVEVDDMSVVPKTIEGSYKSIRDNKYRTYSINVIPAMSCLPVSEWTSSNYKSYEEQGGSGDDVEEGWSEGWSRRGEAARRREEDAGIMEPEKGAVNRPDYAGRNLRMHAPEDHVAEHVERRRDHSKELLAEGEMDIDGANEGHATDQEARLKEEEERRRKGKGILRRDPVGTGSERGVPTPISSGSGSCDPNVDGSQRCSDPLSSEDADSKAGPTVQEGQVKTKPIVISEESQEDRDLGGEGGEALRKAAGDARGATKQEDAARDLMPTHLQGGGIMSQKAAVQVEGRRVGGRVIKQGATEGSKGSAGSVPPGFARIARSHSGPASPFGKLQKGGFKFLKRSAVAASSSLKQGSPVPSKKNKPIAAMSDQEIVEMASNVGVVDQLSKEQIEHLKALERERASA